MRVVIVIDDPTVVTDVERRIARGEPVSVSVEGWNVTGDSDTTVTVQP